MAIEAKGTVSDLVAEQRRRRPTSTPPLSSRTSSTSPARRGGAAWDDAERVVSVGLACAEARAALAHGAPRSTLAAEHRGAIAALEVLSEQIDAVHIDDELVRTPGELAGRRRPATTVTGRSIEDRRLRWLRAHVRRRPATNVTAAGCRASPNAGYATLS